MIARWMFVKHHVIEPQEKYSFREHDYIKLGQDHTNAQGENLELRSGPRSEVAVVLCVSAHGYSHKEDLTEFLPQPL